MNGVVEDGFPCLFVVDYGVGIGEDEVGNKLEYEMSPTIIVETKLNDNDSRILAASSNTIGVVFFPVGAQP